MESLGVEYGISPDGEKVAVFLRHIEWREEEGRGRGEYGETYHALLNAKTGETIWGPERTAQGTVSSSLVLAEGKLFILNENGVTTVVAAGSDYKLLATNELDGSYTLSSPAIAGNQIFIRTGTHLYCIGEG